MKKSLSLLIAFLLFCNLKLSLQAEITSISTFAWTFTCSFPEQQIFVDVNGGTAPITFAWTGPNGFTSSEQNPVASEIGTYIVTVTDVDGSLVDTLTIVGDFENPDLVLAATEISCSGGSAQLSVSGDLSGGFSWTGPGTFGPAYQFSYCFTDAILINPDGTQTNQLIEVVAGGNVLPLNYPINGPDQLVTELNLLGISAHYVPYVQPPGEFFFGFCQDFFIGPEAGPVTEVTIVGFGSDLAEVSSALTPNPIVDAPGEYTLTFTGSNGCVSTETVTVTQEMGPELVLSATDLACGGDGTAQLSIDSPTDLVGSYSWTGPGNFDPAYRFDYCFTDGIAIFPDGTQSNQIVEIVAGGNVLPLNYPYNSSAQLITDLNALDVSAHNVPFVAPDGVIFFEFCSDFFIGGELGPVTSVTQVGFGTVVEEVSSAQTTSPYVDAPGEYTLTFTGNDGCVSTQTVTVGQEGGSEIELTATEISCEEGTADLSVVGSPAGSYSWSGPGNFGPAYQFNYCFTDGIAIYPDGTESNQLLEVVAGGNILPLNYPILGPAQLVSELNAQGISAHFVPYVPPTTGFIDEGYCEEFFIGPEAGPVTSILIVDINTNSLTAASSAATPFPVVDSPGTYTVTFIGSDGCESTQTIEVVAEDCETNPMPTDEEVPTLSEWGLIMLALLFLNFGLLQTSFAPQFSMAVQNDSSNWKQRLAYLPFDSKVFMKILFQVACLVFAGWTMSFSFTGQVTGPDFFGAIMATPLVTYLLHLLHLRKD